MLRLKRALTYAAYCIMLCFSSFASAQDGWGSWGSDQMELIEFLDAEEATLNVSPQPAQALDAPEQNSLNSLDNSGLSDYQTNREASADPGAIGDAASRMSEAIILEPASSSSTLPE